MDIDTEVLKKLNLQECQSLLQVLNPSVSDYLYLWDLENDSIFFAAPINKDYDVKANADGSYNLHELLKLTYPTDIPLMEKEILQVAGGLEEHYQLEYRLMNSQGNRVWVTNRGSQITIADGKKVVVGCLSVTSFDSRIDKLTGLGCSGNWHADLKKAMEEASVGHLLICDVDNMAAINLQKGRKHGDLVLQKIAEVFEDCLGTWHNIYRMCGDRFVVIMPEKTQADVIEYYNNVKKELEEYCTISGGSASFKQTANANILDLIQYAETALLESKSHSKNTLYFFDSEQYDNYLYMIKLQDEMHNAILHNFEGFFVCYQPLLSGRNFALLGAEALIRYRSPQRGIMNPGEFIMLLEKTEMICPVGRWIMREALKQCMEWRKVIPNFYVNVNVSYVQLNKPGFDKEVLEVLKEVGAPGEALTLEITESMHLRDFDKYNRIFSLWKKQGIRIAVDDFGTGYSSLSYLKKLQFDVIKIDQCFVSDVTESAYNYRLISTVQKLANFSDIKICLEGVETEQQLRLLNDLQPDIYQGYLFSRPVEKQVFNDIFMNKGADAYADYNEKVHGFSSIEAKESMRESHLLWNLMNDKPGYDFVQGNADRILRSLELGLWIARADFDEQHFELFLDKNCAEVMGTSKAWSPEECYQYWVENVAEECKDYVHDMLREMIRGDDIVQLEYDWKHPHAGIVRMRCVGVRALDSEGMITLKGYHRVISNIVQTSYS